MSESEFVRSLLVYGVAAIKGNDKQEARSNLSRVLYQSDASVEQKIEAWWWLSQIAEKPEEKRELLLNILQSDPTEPRARREMAILLGKLKPQDVLGPHERGDSSSAVMDSPRFIAHRFVCPQCGGKLSYDISHQEIRCDSCDAPLRDPQPAQVPSIVEEQDFYADLPTVRGRCWELPPERNMKCQVCGASFLVPERNMTASCPYCDSPYAIEAAETARLISPQGVVTFRIDEETAQERARVYLTKHASLLKPKPAKLSPPRGVYIPFWTFDVLGELDWKRRRSVQSQEGWEIRLLSHEYGSQEEESGSFPVNYNDLLIPAVSSLPAELMQRMADFDTGEALPYTIGLIAGWTTEIYQVTMAAASVKAHQLAYERAKEEYLGTLSPLDSLLKTSFSSLGISIDTYKLLLLPVWKMVSSHRNQRSIVLVNGQTGTVADSAIPG